MSYTQDITRPLIDTLTRTAGLPTFQLAGHVPNLPFWMSEVRHALRVIEGYPQRYEYMIAAQNEFDANHPDAAARREQHEYEYSARLAVSPAMAERLSRELISATSRLIDRCLKEDLLDISSADDLRAAALSGDPPRV